MRKEDQGPVPSNPLGGDCGTANFRLSRPEVTMVQIFIAVLSIGGVVAVVYLGMKYGEQIVKLLGNVPTWSAPELTPPPAAPEPEEQTRWPEPRTRATLPAPTPEAVRERFERFSDRRVETAARLLVAEVEEYLAGKADSR